uniref:Uncharacterized protein n=1 Tax=Panagrolaimus davidi TaxID=227884 RepID=A0A914QA64_9BILA
MIKLRKELLDSHTEEEIINARNHVCFDIIKVQKSTSSTENTQEPPPHACKLDSIVKTSEELDIIRKHFVSKFSFLFEDNQELAEKLCEPHVAAKEEEKPYKWDGNSDDEIEEKSEDTILLQSRTFPTGRSPPPKHRSNRTSGFV